MLRQPRPLAILTLAAIAAFGTPAGALDEAAGEWDNLKACEKRLCTMVLTKPASGSDLTCDLSKTWAKSSLKGGEKKGMSWGFGDARCGLDFTLSRADVVSALTLPKHTIQLPMQTVKCQVERDEELKNVTIKLQPKLKFKNGNADKVWINLKEVEGPEDIKGTVSVAAGLEDSLGLFHGPLIRSINKFLHKQCEQRYGASAQAKPAKASAPPKAEAKKAEEPSQAAAAGK
jgi:hypothetical protein